GTSGDATATLTSAEDPEPLLQKFGLSPRTRATAAETPAETPKNNREPTTSSTLESQQRFNSSTKQAQPTLR
ncbi:Hypothetical predicted protein, partial [Pelobates cultripes]